MHYPWQSYRHTKKSYLSRVVSSAYCYISSKNGENRDKKLGFETALPHACIVWAALDRESIFSYTIPYKDDTFSTLDIMQKIAFSFQ